MSVDAHLIALCKRVSQANVQLRRMQGLLRDVHGETTGGSQFTGLDADNRAALILSLQQSVERITDNARRDATSVAAQPAVTSEGIAAKAALLLELSDPATIAGHLAHSLAEDVVRHERAAEDVMRELEREADVPQASAQPTVH